MQMWAKYASEVKTPREKLVTVQLNAWENDFAEDPLVPFISKIEDTISLFKENPLLSGEIKKLKQAGKALAKSALPVAVKVLTLNALDLEKEIEKAVADAAGAGVKDAIELFSKEKEVIQKFRSSLAALAAEVAKAEGGGRLVVFLDELDRCRPDYALRTLERMKHVFGVEGVVFVLFIDREQLGASLRHIYGDGLNDHEYLKRFIDNECRLPPPRLCASGSICFCEIRVTKSVRLSNH
jgi:predicted KAP-like P-loop ATPase